MYYGLEMEQSVHQIDRFHLKSACTDSDGSIIVTGRGRIPNMKE